MNEIKRDILLSGWDYKSIFDALPHASYVWKKKADDLILIYFNKAAEQITEGKVKNFIGIKASDFYKDRPKILDDFNECIAKKTKISRETIHRFVTTGNVKNLVRFYDFIEPDLVFVHTEDITKQKQVEESLKKEEQEKSMILQAVSDHIIYYDTDQTIIWANRAASDSLNMQNEEIIGRKCYELWQNRKEPCDKCPVIRAKETGMTQTEEMKTPDGRVWMVLGFPVRDDRGTIIGMVEITRDITARKYVEENLLRERDILGRITDTSPVGITVVNKIGKISFANPQAEKILGLTKDVITQLTYNAPIWKITDFNGYPFPDDELPFQKVKNTRESVFDVRHAIEWPNGQKRFLSINASPIFDENGNFEGMVATVEDITENWMIEQKLRESEGKFRILAENIPGVIYLCKNDERWTMLYLNDAVEHFTGYPKEDFISDKISFVDLYHPDDTAQIFEDVKRALEKHVPFHLNYRIKHKSGNWRWIDEVGIGIYENDDVVLLEGYLTDITKNKEAEHRLKDSEQFLQNVFNAIQDGVSILDRDLNIIRVNQWMEKMYSSKFPLVGKKCYEVYQDRPSICPWCPSIKTIETGDMHSEVVPYPSAEAPTGWIDLTAFPLKDEEGNVVNVIEYVKDITKQKNAEDKLRESEEKYRDMAELLPDVIFEADLNLKLTYVNPAGYDMFGYSPRDVEKGVILTQFISSDSLKEAKERIKEIFEGKNTSPNEYELLKEDGSKFYGRVHSRPIFKDDKVIGFRGTLTDITDIKVAEDKLKESEEKYREAYNRINLYKDLFTHDISNIFQNILSSNELAMLYSNNPDKLQDYVEVANLIKEQVARGAKLVSNVQKLSELEEFEKPLYSIEVCSVLTHVIDTIKKEFFYKKIIIHTQSVENRFLIKANELIFDIFENILINAVKHNRNRTIEIQIKISKELVNNYNFIKLEFIDNGIGIPDSMKKIIFQRDYRKEKAGGIGLGLLLIKRILESYEGSVKVKDNIPRDYSKGSNFIVIIPEA